MNGANKDFGKYKTGFKERTPEEIDIETSTKPRVRKVHLNKLGLERVNAHRKKRGLPQATNISVAIGSELETVVGEELSPSADAPSALPSSVDNSSLKYFPPIGSQGGLSSCGSFSGTYYTMTHMYAMARNIDVKAAGQSAIFSTKWTYNMTNGGVDGGSWYDFDIGRTNGCAVLSEFPYDSNYRAWCLNPQVWKNALYRRFNQYGYVDLNTQVGVNNMKQMLVDGYVLNTATYVFSWQYKTVSNAPYAGQNCCYWVNGDSGYHAITIVGYDDNVWVDINGNGVVDPGETGAFKIANSWGGGWGNSGFMWVSYDALNQISSVIGGPSAGRKIVFYPARAHYVTAKPEYSPKMLAEFTVNKAKRNQMCISLGTSILAQTAPSEIWYPSVLNYRGGQYAFDGSTNPIDGTFFFDFTDLNPNNLKKYYLRVEDISDSGDTPTTIKAFKIIDLTTTPLTEGNAMDVPKAVSKELKYSRVPSDELNSSSSSRSSSSSSSQIIFQNKVVRGIASCKDQAHCPAGEGPEKCADGLTNTKWLEFKSGGLPFWWQYDFGVGVAWEITSYRLCTANDFAERDPKAWTLQASNTGVFGGEQVIIDTVENGNLPTNRFTWTSIFVCDTPPSSAYRYYRFVISDTKNLSSANCCQIAELEMFTANGISSSSSSSRSSSSSSSTNSVIPDIGTITVTMNSCSVSTEIVDNGVIIRIKR